jgi:hypothetical protein
LPQVFSTGSILIFASLPPALWGIVELGILPGAKGPNLYGADPRNSRLENPLCVPRWPRSGPTYETRDLPSLRSW